MTKTKTVQKEHFPYVYDTRLDTVIWKEPKHEQEHQDTKNSKKYALKTHKKDIKHKNDTH